MCHYNFLNAFSRSFYNSEQKILRCISHVKWECTKEKQEKVSNALKKKNSFAFTQMKAKQILEKNVIGRLGGAVG